MFGEASNLDGAVWAQPALYALGCGLAAFWRGVGLRPSAVLGHGAGEVAAAQAAGMVSLADGMRFAIERGRLIASVRSGGGMGVVFLTAEKAVERIAELSGEDHGKGLAIASDNGGHQVLSGPREMVAGVLERLRGEGVRTAMLSIAEAWHCALMDPILDGIEAAGGAMATEPGSLPFVSGATGEVLGGGEVPDGGYWRRQIRRRVCFAKAVATLAELGVRVLVDLGPRGRTALTASGAWPSREPVPLIVPTLRGPSFEGEGGAEALARAWESGAPVSLGSILSDRGGRRVAVPGYPFERRRYWVDDEGKAEGSPGGGGLGLVEAHASVAARARRIEAFLVRAIKELSGVETLPRRDVGFFELGMDSLAVAELRNRLNRVLDGALRITEAEVFSHPGAARLARHVAERLERSDDRVGERPAAVRRPVGRSPRSEPVAVVGMSCRFPGGGGVEEFWRRLADGRHLVTRGRPDGGLPGLGGRETELWGAYLPELDSFDAEFFGIAPVEAELMDPQQRLLLEVSWAALEDAGIAPGSLEGSRTGVYAGMFASDYQSLVSETPPGLYRSTGSSFSAAIGRVAYALGLEGPAIAVDTACSASLVALHQAVAGLERGEVDLALAGGVNAILTSGLTDAFEAAGMLAPDGRCKTFDAAADGYVRGEGCGMLALMPLSRARAGGHRVLGLILGSAVNQDGASAGLTAPNGLAQERLIAEAVARAGIESASVDYLEAHGTGTPLGDPVELEAAAAAYGPGRDPDRPLLVGSVKTNVGHLEAAAGVAGVIKVLLAMREGRIPPHLHFGVPNPRLDWASLPLSVVTEATPWEDGGDRPRRAAVSSFGYSGTNAHVVIEDYARDDDGLAASGAATGSEGRRPSVAGEARLAPRVRRLLPLSGRGGGVVRELARRYEGWLDEADTRAKISASWLADTAWTAGTGRTHFDDRAAVVFRDAASLRAGLRRVAEVGGGVGSGRRSRVAFLYTGQGSQCAGMGRELYETEPVAREVLDRCEEVIGAERDGSLLDVMFGDADGLDRTEWTQPALYALEGALTALWASVGVRPDAVFGHSVGEIAAAHAAGAFDLEEGLRFAARRGALMGALPDGGAMAAVFAPPDRVRDALPRGVSLAADNGAHQVVSGPAEAVAALAEEFAAAGVRVERLRTSHAFHSELMDPALADLEAAAPEASAPSVPLVGNLTGRALDGTLERAYWRRQAREPVRFAQAVRTLAELDAGVLIEIGPHGVLGPMAALAWPNGDGPAVIPSQRREGSGGFVDAVGSVYEAGLDLSFQGLFAGERRRRVALPTYPFQRERYWVSGVSHGRAAAGHPLLGVRRDSPDGEVSFEREFIARDPAWLGDHRVFGKTVAPVALFVAQAVEAFRETSSGTAITLHDTRMRRPLVVSGEKGRTVRVVLSPEGRWEVASRAREGGTWNLHVEGRLAILDSEPAGMTDIAVLRAALEPVDIAARCRSIEAAGIAHGPAFRGLVRLWSGPGEAVGEVQLPASVDRQGAVGHPALLDACFQVLAGVPGLAADGGAWLPIGWDRLVLRGELREGVVCRATAREGRGDTRKGDVRLYAETGEELGRVDGFTLKRATRAALLGTRVGDLLHEVVWRDGPPVGLRAADFLAGPEAVAASLDPADRYLETEGLDRDALASVAAELERESGRHVLRGFRELGWEPSPGERFEAEALRRRLKVTADHRRLFGRLLGLMDEAGVVSRDPGGGWVVALGTDERPPRSSASPDAQAESGEHGLIEHALLARCGGALADVLRGRRDPLELLFGGEPSAADLYSNSPAARAADRMVADAVRAAVAGLPEGRSLRVLEIGAGTGATTARVLDALPAERACYEFTDPSADLLADAERRFGERGVDVRCRLLEIGRDPVEQGFAPHGYDLVVAADALHATRDIEEALARCRRLLAPSGLLVVVEGTGPRGWLDLTFGLLPGWWRFEDACRPDHALASAAVWEGALARSGYPEASSVDCGTGRTVVLARGPSEVEAGGGLFVLAGGGGAGGALARELEGRGSSVVVGPLEGGRREWSSFFESLPGDVALRGVAHLGGVRGDGLRLSTGELGEELEVVGGGALALVQGMADAGVVAADGVWLVTRGGQVVERETSGALSGAALWGFGSVVELEHGDFRGRAGCRDSWIWIPSRRFPRACWRTSCSSRIARLGSRFAGTGSRRVARGSGGAGRRAGPARPDGVSAYEVWPRAVCAGTGAIW